jgi:MFS family permease
MPFVLTILFGSLPQVFLLPLAGSLADRWNRRWLMIIADTGNALSTLTIVILLANDVLQVWHIYLLAVVGSAFGTFQRPAYQASIAMLVPKRHLARANGMVQSADALGGILMPILAGALFASVGLFGIVLIDFGSYFFAIIVLIIVRIPQPKLEDTAEDKNKGAILKDIGFAWSFLRKRPGLLNLLFYYAIVNFFLSTVFVLNGPLVLSQHSARTYGIVQTIISAGGLVGGLIASIWGGPKNHLVRAVFLGIPFYMIGVVIAGLRIHWIYPAVGLALTGIVVSLVQSISNAIWQMKVSPEIQGRVFSLRYMLATIITPLAYLCAGPLADNVFGPMMQEDGILANTLIGNILEIGPGRGIGLIYIISGIIVVFISIVMYLNPRVRNLEKEIPDVITE